MKNWTTSRRGFLSAAAAVLGGCSSPKPPKEGFALVANQEGRSIAVVDLQALAVVRHIRLDGAPGTVLAHPARPVFYVLMPDAGTVQEITAERLAVTRTLSTGARADQMLMAKDGKALWILSRAGRRLSRMELESGRVDRTIALPADPLGFDVSEERALVSLGERGAALFDLATGKPAATLQPGPAVGTVTFRPDGRQALLAQPGERMLSVYDARSGGVVAHLPLALEPRHFCFNQDGGQLFVTGPGRDAVVVVFPYLTQVTETALVGHAPGAMAASLQYLFVASPQAGDVSVFDIETRKVIAVVAVGAEPVFLTVTPSNKYALVLNRQSGDVSVLLIPAISASRAKRAALFTMIPVGSAPVSAAVQQV